MNKTDRAYTPEDARTYAALLDNIAESIGIVDAAGIVLYFNKITEEYGGVALEEAQGKSMWEIFPFLNAPHYKSVFETTVQTQKPQCVEMFANPAGLWFEVRFVPSGETVTIFSTDISERKASDEALRDTEAKYRALTDSLDQGFCVVEILWDATGRSTDHRYLEVNPAFERITGMKDSVGKTARELVPTVEQHWIDWYGNAARADKPFHIQQGSVAVGKVFDVFAARIDDNRVVALFADITDRVRLEQEREALLERLRRSMAETHHRVKNNLQVITSLVEIQVTDMDAATTIPLHRINQHVQAMAVIHDLLTQRAKSDGDTDHLGTQSILETLLPQLQNTIGQRTIIADTDEVTITAQKAASFALLVSECVSNAVKHANGGTIEITLKREGDSAKLEVCDDGEGFPIGFNPRKEANTGLDLIESAARWDLGGTLAFDNHSRGGGRVTVTFPIGAPA